MKPKQIFSLLARLLAAGIMLQTLYFKFTAQPESIYIFSRLGMEPWGRIGSGIAELVASGLLLWPSTVVLGAVLGACIMLGAVAAHATLLGIEVMGDGGQLFIYALIVLIACISLVILHFRQLLLIKDRVFVKRPIIK
ncbi:MAG: DoxX family protein [Chitinophagaceae bacterium]|nr:DoxX family protein [Sphingobacteriales bacterium]TXJ23151.1 MAG: DoxX family protein [Chitinophagaceae bacterium]